MIFWTTVLTFIIGLMVTMLFPRTDRVNVEELPVSEAYVASFVAQHQFARDYADQIALTLPYIQPISGSDIQPISGSDELSDKDKAAYIHIFKDEFDNLENGYMPKMMPDDVSRKTFPTDGSYTSAIVCMDGLDKTVSSGETKKNVYGNVVSCKTPIQTFKYVLTYGALFPQNQVQHNLYKTRLDTSVDENEIQRNRILWEKALAKRTKGDPDCGYIGIESKLPYIFSVDGQKRRIPLKLYEVFKLNEYFPDDSTYDYQPIFCITPVNSPYIADGLMYHFDSTMNNKNEHGAPIHDDKKTGWLDIISQTEVPFIDSTAESIWNPNKEVPLAMASDIYIRLDSSNGKESLNREFTLSFVAQFDQHDPNGSEAPLFSTNTGSFPYILAKYKSGQLTVSIYQAADKKIGEIQTIIPYSITAISYVIGPRFHHLFVNGKKVASETFANDIYFSGISSSPSIFIGASPHNSTNKINADMYNIKIYNRALNMDEIQHNLKTEKKRYNF